MHLGFEPRCTVISMQLVAHVSWVMGPFRQVPVCGGTVPAVVGVYQQLWVAFSVPYRHQQVLLYAC
jgi:hypothetical protein